MTDPNLPSNPPTPKRNPYDPTAGTERQPTDGPPLTLQAPRAATSADPWTPASGASIPMVPRMAPQPQPPGPNLPVPTRKGGASAPMPQPGPRPAPSRPPRR